MKIYQITEDNVACAYVSSRQKAVEYVKAVLADSAKEYDRDWEKSSRAYRFNTENKNDKIWESAINVVNTKQICNWIFPISCNKALRVNCLIVE